MVGVCDCNNFFVSCERVFNPSLNGKPVVVLSNNDGCIISRSNEAKRLGIKMGQPYFQIKRFCDENGVKIFSSNYALYSDMSHRVMSILRETVPHIEVYSVDEAFIGFDTADTEILAKTGRRIVERVLRCTGIPVSVGISPSKTLAKIASKLSKQYPRLNGMCLMYRKEDVEKVLKNFPVGDVWGIGRRLSARLVSMGYSTAWDFYRMGKESARHIGGIGTERTWEELHGTSCIELETEERNRQQICVSRSFAEGIKEFEEMRSVIVAFASKCAEKLRREKSLCGALSVFMRGGISASKGVPDYDSRAILLETPTDNTAVIAGEAVKALSMIFDRRGNGYKKAGVVLTDISPKCHRQTRLFDETDHEREGRFLKVVDAINAANGANTIVIASQGFDGMKVNRNHLSKHYTTDWDDILTVNV